MIQKPKQQAGLTQSFIQAVAALTKIFLNPSRHTLI